MEHITLFLQHKLDEKTWPCGIQALTNPIIKQKIKSYTIINWRRVHRYVYYRVAVLLKITLLKFPRLTITIWFLLKKKIFVLECVVPISSEKAGSLASYLWEELYPLVGYYICLFIEFFNFCFLKNYLQLKLFYLPYNSILIMIFFLMAFLLLTVLLNNWIIKNENLLQNTVEHSNVFSS